jgi:hypothetical protein
VQRVAEAGGDDLRLQAVALENLHRLPHHLHPLVADVVQASDEGTDVGGAGQGGQQGLVGREGQGGVDGDAPGPNIMDYLAIIKDSHCMQVGKGQAL